MDAEWNAFGIYDGGLSGGVQEMTVAGDGAGAKDLFDMEWEDVADEMALGDDTGGGLHGFDTSLFTMNV